MTWNSGPCLPHGGMQIIVTDAYPEKVIVIPDDEVRADEAERQRVVMDESVELPHMARELHQP